MNSMKSRLKFCIVLGVTMVFSAMLGLVWTGHMGRPGQWQKLAEITNSTGQRFVVAQKCQLVEGEGWRVGFWFVDSDKRLYGSLLELETMLPWRKVHLIQTNETVEVRRRAQLVGTLNLSGRVFRNALNGALDTYVEGFNGVQGTVTTNFVFDVP